MAGPGHLPLQRYFCQKQVRQGQGLRQELILGPDEMTGLSIPAGMIPVLLQQQCSINLLMNFIN